MENDDTKNGQSKGPANLPVTTVKTKAGKEQGKISSAYKKSSKQKKWTFRRHWKQASRRTQAKWAFEGLGAIIAIAILITYIVGIWQTKWNFQAQHRPIVINSRPPALLQSFSCDPTKGFHSGTTQVFLKNVGNGIATNLLPYWSEMKFVPDHKLGNKIWDDPPYITPKVCSMNPPVDQKFTGSLAPGQEGAPVISEMTGTVPPLEKGAIGQFFLANCVFYSDEDRHYGTCNTYRLFIPSDEPLDRLLGTPNIVCDGREVTGKFEPAIAGHCQN
jgi:hypothetical protein